MRLFAGIAMSEEARQVLERATLRLRAPEDGLRWSLPEQWHITLVFLGTVGTEQYEPLVRVLRGIRGAVVPVEVDGVGMFDRPGILYAAVEVSPALARLQRALAKAVESVGFELEDRPYRPHITLARSRHRAGAKTLSRLRPKAEQQRVRARWNAPEFLLYESVPSPSGSRYEVRERFVLTEGE
jgi:RNA 2',3'-cyclic 3'-phosphodiesterase